MSDKCRWLQEEAPDGDSYHHTSCDNYPYFIEGGIKDNRYKYCPYCGKEIEEVKDA